MDLTHRHVSTQQIFRHFAYEHLKVPMRGVSAQCHDLAVLMISTIPDGPELTAGLRKLLEAKDCFVRAALDTAQHG
jgi:hypothetical protein